MRLGTYLKLAYWFGANLSSGNSSPGQGGSRTSSAAIPPVLLLLGVGTALLVMFSVYFALTAKHAESLSVGYGRRGGADTSTSVNGTRILATMFKKMGFEVSTVARLSPGLKKKAQVLVWFPDDYDAPPTKTRAFVEEWLKSSPGRVAVFLGRDFDAAPLYWRQAKTLASPADQPKFVEGLARAQSHADSSRSGIPKDEYGEWFTIKGHSKKRAVKTLEGPWADGIDPNQVEIEVEGRLDVPVAADFAATAAPAPPYIHNVLLSSNQEPLVTEVTRSNWQGSRILVVANGSFLLNYPLVNHEHRKLAGKLIEECSKGGLYTSHDRVVFIESGRGGPVVLEKEEKTDNGPKFLRIWPLNAIFLHLTLLGIAYCFACTAIFGRPRELNPEPRADFGKHVTALGQLLARTRNREYAEARLLQYQQQGKRNSGKSHAK